MNNVHEIAMKLIPPPAHVCQECAVPHDPAWPHDPESLFYQVKFYMGHGREPTWKDSAAHCTDEVRADWLTYLNAVLRGHGMPTLDENWEPPATQPS